MEWAIVAIGLIQVATIGFCVYAGFRAQAWSEDIEECDRINDDDFARIDVRLRALETKRGARPRKEIAQ